MNTIIENECLEEKFYDFWECYYLGRDQYETKQKINSDFYDLNSREKEAFIYGWLSAKNDEKM